MAIRVALIGPGRMGQVVARNFLKNPLVKLVLVASRPGSEKVGKDLGEILDLPPTGLVVQSSEHLGEALGATRPDMIIDFTTPEASLRNLKVAAKHGVHLIVGTTGYTRFQLEALRSYAEMYRVSLVMATNLSIGINVLMHAARKMASILGGFDVEIIEEHHRYKKDAPSGTALRLAQTVAREIDVNPEKGFVYGRHGNRKRDQKEITIHAVRGGGTVGVHKIIFISDNERLEITHESLNRNAFTDCLSRIIEYLYLHPPGIYTVEEILGLEPPEEVVEEEVS
ncbi:MAG: 4-hydroxy-tetrahydrodipicolinate reductase [Bacillota bacterium]